MVRVAHVDTIGCRTPPDMLTAVFLANPGAGGQMPWPLATPRRTLWLVRAHP
jgi:hypothetical protein